MVADLLGWVTLENISRGIAVIVFTILGIVAWVAFQYLVRLVQRLRRFLQSRRRALRAVGRDNTHDGPREGTGVWLSAPVYQPENYSNNLAASRILAVANLKGGVGKTTLVPTFLGK